MHKGYKCQDSTGKIYVTRHATFHENTFPYKTFSLTPVTSSPVPQSSAKLFVLAPSQTNSTSTPTITTSNTHSMTPSPSPATSASHPNYQNISQDMSNPPDSPRPSTSQPLTHVSPTSTLSPRLQTSHPSHPIPLNTHSMVTRSKVGIFKPKVYLSTASCSSSEVPSDIHTAMASECWQAAIRDELQALARNNTWTICPLPENRRAVGCKWLFKVKKKADGSVDRYKARLVAKGFS